MSEETWERNGRENDASDLFWDTLRTGAGIAITCPCGVTHYCDDYGYDEGEREHYEAEHKKRTNSYVFHISTSIERVEINGTEYIQGCFCDRAQRFEQRMINSRFGIARMGAFLSAWSSQELKRIQGESDYLRALETLSGELLSDERAASEVAR